MTGTALGKNMQVLYLCFISLQKEADVKMLKHDEAEWLRAWLLFFNTVFGVKTFLKFKENMFVNLIKEAQLNLLEHQGL